MTWFRVDDTFPHHAKVLAAGNAAVGLWARAGAWSMQQLTDGLVPTHVARTMGSSAEAMRLVDVGLWLVDPAGYRFHQWEGRQPSREKVEADRHAATERQRKAREAAKSRRESRSDTAVSHGPPDPTRPDPTHNYKDADASSPSRAPRSEPEGAGRFEEFWETYGHKKDRASAEKKWILALRKPGVTADLLIASAAAYVLWERTENEGGRFIMGPAKWLLNERWTDERPARPAPQTRVQEHLALVRRLEDRNDTDLPMLGGSS